MNLADSDNFARSFHKFGFEKAESPETSDIVLINTCVVRAKAEDKAISYLGEIECLRKKNPNLRVILAGCLAPLADQRELKRRFPSILFTIRPDRIEEFESILSEHLDALTPAAVVESETRVEEIGDDILEMVGSSFHAFVNVMRGCEQHCTFCIVPKTRGKNASRPSEEIIEEIQWRISEGAKAITLLGQSILDYGKDWQSEKSIRSVKGDDLFRELLDKISAAFPDTWIKFLTSHPKDFTFETVNLIASRSNISRFLHLPVQSGDDEILKRMNRGHDRQYYLNLIDYIYQKIPDVRLSTDIIVGFPGEDLSAFENTMDLLKKSRFFKVFTFQYSTRPNTPAEKFKDDLPFEEKRKRLNQLIDLVNQITIERHRELVGEVLDVMVEGESKGIEGYLLGRSLGEDMVIFKDSGLVNPGDIVKVRILEGRQRTLVGESA
jgi:tRNA-2-methylthio-N6-dimethylallyladenosine synthase